MEADTVTCPGRVTVSISRLKDGSGVAKFAKSCTACSLAGCCTTSVIGRKIRIGINEVALTRARTEQSSAEWRMDYRKTRPKVERKLAHLMRHRHGGRRSRVRGRLRIDADFSLLCAATNLARLAKLGISSISHSHFSFDEAYRSETGKAVPADLYIGLAEHESVDLDVRDRAHADQIVAAIVGVDDENQLLANPELIL